MDDTTKHLLDRLDKTLEDSKLLGRAAITIIVPVGLAVLTSHGKGDEIVPGMLSSIGIAVGSIFLIAFWLWSRALRLNNQEVTQIVNSLWDSNNLVDPKPADPDLHRILDAKIQYRRRFGIYVIRQGVVGASLILIWFHLADVGECIASFDQCRWPVQRELPRTIPLGQQTLKLNGGHSGSGPFSIGLYLEQPNTSSSEIIKSTEIRVVRLRFTKYIPRHYAATELRDLIKPDRFGVQEAEFTRFLKDLPQILANDVIDVHITPEATTIVSRTGGADYKPELGTAILRRLIGWPPMGDGLRLILLGCKKDDKVNDKDPNCREPPPSEPSPSGKSN